MVKIIFYVTFTTWKKILKKGSLKLPFYNSKEDRVGTVLENASHLTYLSLVRLTSLSLSYKHEEIQEGESGFGPRSFEPVLSNQWSVPHPMLTPEGDPYSWTAMTVEQPGVPWSCRCRRGAGLGSAALLPVCCCWPRNSCDSFRTHTPSLFLLPSYFLL